MRERRRCRTDRQRMKTRRKTIDVIQKWRMLQHLQIANVNTIYDVHLIRWLRLGAPIGRNEYAAARFRKFPSD